MNGNEMYLLTVNAGSSSIKFAVFKAHSTTRVFEVSIDNIGASARLTSESGTEPIAASDHGAAVTLLMRWVAEHLPAGEISTVCHRVVHGGPNYHETQAVTDMLLADLRELAVFDPEHLPIELRLIEVCKKVLPSAVQLVCFDTAFHRTLPDVARRLPLPRQFFDKGIRKYGFHGLSYASILEELRRVEGEVATRGKVIIAHLGSGVSLVALSGGQSIDTTMAMTPASGVTMSTRSGDLDPGLVLYLSQTEDYDSKQFNHLVNFESGLLGMSETTADMEQLLRMEEEDSRAKEAVDVFCYQVRKSIGSLTAALGGLNTLVFTGGMGEHAPKIRARVCEELAYLGIALNSERNARSERLISTDQSLVGVHVIHADEALTMARESIEYHNNRLKDAT
ncbi:MAG TPA: acetate/propionate family kinase [Candidatus Saccharimonadales bacterium]|nr:acetate/propionate family kinase [Candidatus Saccharimonadales bacterium]